MDTIIVIDYFHNEHLARDLLSEEWDIPAVMYKHVETMWNNVNNTFNI